MVLRSCPRCRAIAEIVQPRRWSACASTSSSRVIIGGGGPFGLPVVRDQQPGRGLRRLGGATRVGKFSKQVWGESPERRQGRGVWVVSLPDEENWPPGGRHVPCGRQCPTPILHESALGGNSHTPSGRNDGEPVVDIVDLLDL